MEAQRVHALASKGFPWDDFVAYACAMMVLGSPEKLKVQKVSQTTLLLSRLGVYVRSGRMYSLRMTTECVRLTKSAVLLRGRRG